MIYCSATELGFYDSAIHGTRLITIQDPAWVRPTTDIVVQPGESVWVGDELVENKGDEPITFRDVPDMAAIPDTLEVDNPACLIPVDAVEITQELHAALLEGQSAGKVIACDGNGYPVLVDPPVASLEELQSTAWDAIKGERDRRKDSGFKVGNEWVHSDLFSRSQWLGLKDNARDALAAGGTMESVLYDCDGLPIAWKMLDGSFVQVTAQLAFDVVAAVTRSDLAIFKAAEVHKATMLAAENPAAYNYSTGWPQTYAESVQILPVDPETIPPVDPEPEEEGQA